jgi:hypothetical protein
MVFSGTEVPEKVPLDKEKTLKGKKDKKIFINFRKNS